MSVRPAGQDDAPAMAAQHAAAFERPWTARDIRNFLSTHAQGAVFADAGFILWRAVAGEAEILTLAVRPQSRRAGVARALLAHAMDQAAARGAKTLFLEVADDNAAAIALYIGAGFTEAGRRRAYYQTTGGQMRDAIILRRTLNSGEVFDLS